MTRRAVRAVAVLVLVLAGTLLAAVPAEAHAYVVATDPPNGAELTAAPTRIRVTFSEPVTLPSARGSASVLTGTGQDVAAGAPRLRDGRRTLVVGIRPGVAKGAYVASWSVVSADSHPVGGSIQFGYGVPANTVAAPAVDQPDPVLQLLVGVLKGLLYLGLVAALGLVPAALVLGADAGERLRVWWVARLGAVVAIVASVLQVVAQYLWDASAVPGGPDLDGLARFAGSGFGITVLVRVVLLVGVLVVLPRPRWWPVAAVLAVAVLGTVVRNGHGGNGSPWIFVSTLVHVVAVVAWLGGLAVLGWLVLRRRLTPERMRRLPLWSRYAAVAAGLLVLTGAVQAVVRVRHPAALVGTTYGWVLVVKLLLVAVALAIGLWGNRWIARTGPDVPPGETARLRSRVRVEAGAGAAVVLVSGLLSSTPPAEVTYAPHRVVQATVGPYAVKIEVAPARRGPQTFRITAVGPDAATPPVRSLDLDLRAGGARALPVTFPYRLPGALAPGRATPVTFVSAALSVPVTGDATGTLTLVAGPTLQYTATFTYPVV